MNPFLSAFLSKYLIDRTEGHRAAVLEVFRARGRSDRQDVSARHNRQNESLASLLKHVQQHVPFYRERMAGEEIITAQNAREILARLPVIRRADIQQDSRKFESDNTGVCADDATGGSTGTPMVFKVDRDTQIAREASLMWANSLAGWRPGEKIAMLWGSGRDVQGASGRLRLAARWWMENMRWYNAFDMGENRMEKFHEDLSSFRPHLLVAYAGSVFTYARFLKERGWAPRYPLRAIVASAEVLAPSMRQVIEEVFGKPVFDRYGNREFAGIAAECEAHQGLHINEDDCIVEIDSPDPFRQEGPILVTYLKNRAMPFLRYDTGDAGRFASRDVCACGRNTIRLAPVTGRQSDTIRTASGNLIHGEYFTHLLYGARGVKEFQFVQESESRYTLRLVAERHVVEQREASLKENILEVVGRESDVRIEYVSSIPATSSGKRKFTISKL